MPEQTADPRRLLQRPLSAVSGGVAVVTDAAAGLPPEWLAGMPDDGRLAVVPMPVMVGEDIHGEAGEDVSQPVALALAAGRSIRTSRPSPRRLEATYRAAQEAGYSAIVSIHLSGALSGTVESARLAAGQVGLPVHVLDSRTVGMAQGFAVQAAVAAAVAGADADDVVAVAQQHLDAARILFYVPTLEQLRRGGRIGTAATWLGTVFAVKPLLCVRDGLVAPLERVRTAAKALARLEELARTELAGKASAPARLAVHHFGNEQQARDVADRLAAGAGEAVDVSVSALPPVLAAHTGLGVLAVVIGTA
ncbi:MAG: degV protein [Micrococcaceae bacterium]|jgi:DegV family protein with EDD domain|nr:degV protein [Micrococcaceae bacterium]